MRAVVQRVARAAVSVVDGDEEREVGRIGPGLAVLIASIGIFSAEAYLLLRFSAHDMFAPEIADFFFVPVVAGLIVLLVGVASGFSWWVFRHTAHEAERAA